MVQNTLNTLTRLERLVQETMTLVQVKAAQIVLDRLHSRGSGVGIRVGVRTAGCSGYAYTLEYVDSVATDDVLYSKIKE